MAVSATLACVLVGFAGCGGKVVVDADPDSGDGTKPPLAPDTTPSYPDTRPKPVLPDTRVPPPDERPFTCASDLPADFACTTPKIPAGESTCTEAMIQEFVTGCFGGDSTSCTAWTKKYADCNKCVMKFISPSGYIEYGDCMAALAPTSPCGKLYTCNIDCYERVCEACDHTAGSGRTSTRSEFGDCVSDSTFAGTASKPKGRCYDVVTKDMKAASCESDPCVDVVQFFRGACRDVADWTNMTSATPK